MPGNMVPGGDRSTVSTGGQLLTGFVAVLTAAAVAATTCPPGNLAGRALIMAMVIGVYAAVAPDLRVVLGVTLVALAAYVLLLANADGDVTESWQWPGFLIPIGFAALLGRGQRWMRTPPEPQPAPGELPNQAPHR